jgi:inosine/xanthosine triphosphatase
MKIVVGSNNPVKVEAVREAFAKYFTDLEVAGVQVESGVAEQPRSEQETIMGAKNRAKKCISEADYGVGLEGGVCDIEGRMFECAWVAIVDKKGVEGIAGGLYFELPRKVAEKIRAGGELGPIMEEIMKFDVKRTSGAIGVFTKGQLDRKQAYVQIVLSALIKFVSPEWFI